MFWQIVLLRPPAGRKSPEPLPGSRFRSTVGRKAAATVLALALTLGSVLAWGAGVPHLSPSCRAAAAQPPAQPPAQLAAQPAAPASPHTGRKAVVVAVPALSAAELASVPMPHLAAILGSQGSSALMNTRTAGSATMVNAGATLSAGSRALAPVNADQVLMASESIPSGDAEAHQPAAVVFRRRTGFALPPGGLGVLNEPALQAANAENDHPTFVGSFADALRTAGLRVAYLGDSDGLSPHRPGALLAADSRGIISQGLAGEAARQKDPSFPWGTRADYAALEKAFVLFYRQADVVVVEAGDLERINTYSPLASPERQAYWQALSLKRLDAFIGHLWERINPGNTRLFIVGPMPGTTAYSNRLRLGFFLMAGGGLAPGLLEGATTHWAGICANIDVAPTILQWLGVPEPAGMLGEPVYSRPLPPGLVPAENQPSAQLAWLGLQANQLASLTNIRPAFLKTFVYIQIVLVLAILAMVFWPNAARPLPVLRFFIALLLILTTYPLALLLGGAAVSSLHPWLMGAVVVIISLVLPLVARLAGKTWEPLGAFAWIYIVTALVVVLDAVTGWHLARSSPLGYDPQDGARYYGIGNEYEGVTLGAVVAAMGAFWQWWQDRRHGQPPPDGYPNWRQRLLWSLPFWLVAVVFFHPGWGADVGGALAALTACLAWLILPGPGRKPNYKSLFRLLMVAALIGTLLLLLVAAWDATRPLPSHVGKLWLEMQSQGATPFLDTVQRKLSMNWRLLHFTYWADALVAFLAALLALFFFRPTFLWDPLLKDRPYLAHGLEVSLITAVAEFALNDSGVVAAATLSLYPVAMLFTLWCWSHLAPSPR